MSQPGFSVDVYQNEFLPEGGQDVNAVVTVTSSDTPLATSDSGEQDRRSPRGHLGRA